MSHEPTLSPSAAARAWAREGPVRPSPDPGLINRTYLVGDPPEFVLQWVHPIFPPEIHLTIAALVDRLTSRGLDTPRLLRTREDAWWLPDEIGCWRLLTFVPGRTLHRLSDPGTATAAGRLVGRFHRAVAGWEPPTPSTRRAVAHDTVSRMGDLARALESADGHHLEVPVRQVGRRILQSWAAWDGELELPLRFCHGDLKISNLRFATDRDDALCLIDLDTLGPMSLPAEMGDAWRSWCNPAPEDDPEASRFDLGLFEASARAWRAEVGPLEPLEAQALAPTIERIALELAARFAVDALAASYFAEDRTRYPIPGAHNLERARGQLVLAVSARTSRSACETILARS